MAKKHSKKFWVIFWLVSAVFLVVWYFFWEFKHQGFRSVDDIASSLPIEFTQKEELRSIAKFAEYLMQKDGRERVFLILFQNNMEIRPGGGYIGSFGILKVKDGQVTDIQTHDLSNFDGRVPSTVEPPYPMKTTLNINSWKLRDSNWSPDFKINAQKAEEFYYMGQGQEKFDAIAAINTDVLISFLKVTGPVEIPGYPGTYDSENAVLALEKQVERDAYRQGIPRGERKSIMNPFASEIIKKASNLSVWEKVKLSQIILEDLNNKDIQLYFKDSELQKQAALSSWSGNVKQDWQNDYLMMIDANLASLKSDYFIKRSFEYRVDFRGSVPKANLKITYHHTGKEKDWMTNDYQTYLRVYVPDGSWLTESKNIGEMKYGNELGKKFFGSLFTVPLGQTKTIEINYDLPSDIASDSYDLLIQKQSGVGEVAGKVIVIDKSGQETVRDINLKNEWTLAE